MKYLAILILLLSSCKTSQKCEAYSEKFDIHEDHQAEMKKYCSIETIK